MPSEQPTTEKTSPRPWIDPRDQAGVLVLLASLLVMTMCYWWFQGGHRGQLIEIDRAAPLEANFLVDINAADWPEIVQLPGLGEVLAKRLMADRSNNGPFRDVDDLVRVDGIGVKTLQEIRPYLLPISQNTDWAATSRGDDAGP